MEEEIGVEVYDYDEEFQKKILGFLLRDEPFSRRTEGLINPRYFELESHRLLADIAVEHILKYKSPPGVLALGQRIKDRLADKKLSKEQAAEVVSLAKEVFADTLEDRDYFVEMTSKFAKKQALTAAIIKSATAIDKGDFTNVEAWIREASLIGESDASGEYDFFERVDDRAEYREMVLAGKIKPDGVPTGYKDLDDRLYHKGWGRKELSVIMGPAKAGKSMSLIGFAMNAVLSGYNVLFVSLEVACKIIADRFDAAISQVDMNELQNKLKIASTKVKTVSGKAGALKIHDFPSGTFTPNQLRRLINRYDASGIQFDMIVVDYADLMAPDVVFNDPRENSRLVYLGLRAIAYEFNLALLSATQTNREGFKAAVGKMEHVAEDINKVRTVELMISINSTDDEKAREEARLYFAASRNQRGDFSIRVKTKLSQARFIHEIMGIE